MVSTELLRRYPFFAGLSHERITSLSKIANEISVDEGHYFFYEAKELDKFYLVLEGAVAIVFELPVRDVKHKISEQFERNMKTKDVTVSTGGTGDVFGWSGLVPPHIATAGAKALTSCRVVALGCEELRGLFDEDYHFAYLMTRRAAQVMRDRLRDIRIESLAFIA